MPWTFKLSDGSTTLDLDDGTNTWVLVNGFTAPVPPRVTSYTGPNLFRHGEDLVERRYGNREIGIRMEIKGNSYSDLGSRVQSIWDMLRKAEEWSRDGVGTRVQLLYGWTAATGTVAFNVIEGVLEPGPQYMGNFMRFGTRIRDAEIRLVTEPFAVGTAETLDNFVKDPSFEVAGSPMTDWIIEVGASGAGTRTTAQSTLGTAAAQIIRYATNNDDLHLTQVIATGFTGSSNIAASVWVKAGSMTSGISAQFRVAQINTAGTLIVENIATSTATAWTKLTYSTVGTANLGTIRIRLSISGGPASSSATAWWDGVYLGTNSAIPNAWISGRAVSNHYDDDGQAHINYVDLYNIPGDMPAPMQVKVNETEAHSSLWVGARHAGRQTDGGSGGIWIEGELFTSTIGSGWESLGSALMSDGSFGAYNQFAEFTSTAAGTPQVIMNNIVTPPVGQYRVLMVAAASTALATVYAGVGYQYGSITVDPSVAAHYKGTLSTLMRQYDLGIIKIPPLDTPEGGTVGTFGLRIAHYKSTATNVDFQVDSVFLMPVDYGGVYVSKTSAADNMWVDSRSRVKALYRVSTSDVVQSLPPQQMGSPPELHPKGSRIYFSFGSGTAIGSIGHGATVSASYFARYLQVGT